MKFSVKFPSLVSFVWINSIHKLKYKKWMVVDPTKWKLDFFDKYSENRIKNLNFSSNMFTTIEIITLVIKFTLEEI